MTMRATKKTTTSKAIQGRKPGGAEWKTAAGRVFMGDERMSASLSLYGAGTSDEWRAIKARVFRLAADAQDASPSETWVIYVSPNDALVIEFTKDAGEPERACALLVKLLEGASK